MAERSRSYRFLVEYVYLLQSIGAVVLAVAGLVATVVAVVSFSGFALTIALVCLPFGAILWLSAKGLRGAGRGS